MKKFFLSICLLLSVFTIAVYAETEQDEINQVLSIFKSYEYEGLFGSLSNPPRQIRYWVYDNGGKKFHIRFGSRYDNYDGHWYSWINIDPTPWDGMSWPEAYEHHNKNHYPVQEFINKVRADSRIALSSGGQGSKQIPQTSKQNQNSFSNTQSSKNGSSGSTSMQQSTQQNNNSSASYQTITISEYYAFKSQYYNKKVVIDAYLSGIDEQCFIIYGKNGGVLNIYYNFPAESVRKLMSYENHKVRVYAHGIKIYGSADALYCDKIEIE